MRRVRRVCVVVALVAATVAAALAFTGGFSIRVARILITSHSAQNPALFALLAAAAAIWLGRPDIQATLICDLRALAPKKYRPSPATCALIAGTALRLWYWFRAPPLWLDEQMIAINIRARSFGELTGPLWLAQSAPLGWLATERLAGLMFGFGEMALRAVPTAFGIATLVAGWWVGRRFLSAIGAASFVFLLAIGQWVFHYSLEVKHYSADMCFGLLLPVLVVWAIDGHDTAARLRRAAAWWAVAVVAQWWSMGGLLAAPACAIALIVALWRRDGLRTAVIGAAIGGSWLAAFAWHYYAALRFSVGNTFLQTTWAAAMAPASAGIVERVRWVLQQAAPLADKPGGTGLAWLFWITAVCGFAVARPRLLGAVLAAIPASAAVLGLLRVVPLFERFTLWATPALYLGIALALDAGVRWSIAPPHRRWFARAAGVVMVIAAVAISVDVGRRASMDIPAIHQRDTNHQLDDRSAVAWLAGERRPGDAFITTHLALPALWWYGAAPITSSQLGDALDGIPIFELAHNPDLRCDPLRWTRLLAPQHRVLLYLGFRFDDVPKGFDDAVLDELREFGDVSDFRKFGEQSIAVIVNLAAADPRPRRTPESAASLGGCLSMQPAARW